jgi:hypothetical protein
VANATGISAHVSSIVAMYALPDLPKASVLVIRGGVNEILCPLGKNANDMFAEQRALTWDTKAFMYGRVVNKKARYNLCFGETKQEPNYEAGHGRVVPWSEIPLTDAIRRFFALVWPKFRNLVAEGNNYWDARKCGISFHGDTERRLVIAARLGAPIPLEYQWYQKHKPIGPRIRINLNHGDIYIMSDKAVGHDWKSSSKPTLRHAAGASQYLLK